jgi:hypothetical protein
MEKIGKEKRKKNKQFEFNKKFKLDIINSSMEQKIENQLLMIHDNIMIPIARSQILVRLVHNLIEVAREQKNRRC